MVEMAAVDRRDAPPQRKSRRRYEEIMHTRTLAFSGRIHPDACVQARFDYTKGVDAQRGEDAFHECLPLGPVRTACAKDTVKQLARRDRCDADVFARVKIPGRQSRALRSDQDA